jgi:hypothetical protein
MGEAPCYGEDAVPVLCEWAAKGRTGPVARRNALPPPGTPIAPKTMAEKALSLGRAILAEVTAGGGPVSAELYAARLAVCYAPCEFNVDRTCKLCGCGLKAKAWLSQTKCDMGLWPDPPEPAPAA